MRSKAPVGRRNALREPLYAYWLIEARYGYEGVRDLAFYLQEAAITVVPFDALQAELARAAYATYGKGRHQASLNFGDCFAYALAKRRGEPLLFKGEDFSPTDVGAAQLPS